MMIVMIRMGMKIMIIFWGDDNDVFLGPGEQWDSGDDWS